MSVLSCRAVFEDGLTGDGGIRQSVCLSAVCCSVVCPALTICRPADGCPVPFCPVLFGLERCLPALPLTAIVEESKPRGWARF